MKELSGRVPPLPEAPRWALPAVLGAALAVRLAHYLAVRRLPFVDALVLDSAEYDRWARRIASGDWLGGDPFFQAPLYPYLVALVYRAIASPHAVYLVQIATAVAGLWALYRAGREMAGERAGLSAAALGAFYAPFVFHDVQLLKESLATSLVAALLWALAVARRRATTGAWLVVGGLVGLLALLRENALLVAPVLAALFWQRREWGRAGRLLAAYAAGVALVLLPVVARNAALGGGFLPTTYQGGVNFYIGNNPLSDGTYRPLVPGRQVPELERREPWRLAEAALERPLTAAEVSSFWLGRALRWAREQPAAFARLQVRKLALYWSGYEWPDAVDYYWIRERSPVLLALGLELPGLALLAMAGLVAAARRRLLKELAPAWLFGMAWMAATVVFFLFSRYRVPGLPPLLLFGGVAIAALLEEGRKSRRWSWALAALLIAAWGGPRLLAYSPRLDLVHLNLGRLAVERGDRAGAERELRAALVADPRSAPARLELGTLAARDGRLVEALGLLEEAVELEPASPEAWANLGGIRLAMAEPRGARAALERAIILDPTFAPALANRVLVELADGELDAARVWHRRLAAASPDHPAVAALAGRLGTASEAVAP